MTKAWRLLTSAILRLAAAKRCSSQSAISGSKISLRSSACGDGVARDVVFGGPEAAGEDHDCGARHGLRAPGVGQAVAVVADDALGDHFDAEVVQLRGEVERVGVDALAASASRCRLAMISAFI